MFSSPAFVGKLAQKMIFGLFKIWYLDYFEHGKFDIQHIQVVLGAKFHLKQIIYIF